MIDRPVSMVVSRVPEPTGNSSESGRVPEDVALWLVRLTFPQSYTLAAGLPPADAGGSDMNPPQTTKHLPARSGQVN